MIGINLANYSYQNMIPVIKNINISLQEGKITTFVGVSGCGKSTFLRVLMGMETGANGTIIHNNTEYLLENWNSKQNFSLWSHKVHSYFHGKIF